MGLHDPDICACCGRHAVGIGFDRPTRWLCAECLPLIEYVKDIRRWDPYEVKALDAVDDATGEFAASIAKTDIAEFTDEERRGLWRCAIKAHQAEIRRLVRTDEAMW
ncbi:hypothetical protein QBK99_19195 [Corticibacterium sp. UT-5YL-CI-8]|nr:hypothetical protein [Tianweitania sp. UT-5YL-CI-8]